MERTIACLLLVATLAGCIGLDEGPGGEPPGGTNGADPDLGRPSRTGAPGNEAGRPPPPAALWSGQVLEAIDCIRTVHNAFADREAVESRLPAHLAVPGTGPVGLVIQLLDCQSLAIGNQSQQEDSWIYMTHVTVNDDEPTTQGHIAYLLEFGSDWENAWAPLQHRGTPARGGTFQHAEVADADTLTFTSEGLAYTLHDAGSGPMPVERGPSQIRLLAGPEATTVMELIAHHRVIDNLPTAGTLDLQGGVLGELLGPAAPSVSSEGAGSATFRETPETG